MHAACTEGGLAVKTELLEAKSSNSLNEYKSITGRSIVFTEPVKLDQLVEFSTGKIIQDDSDSYGTSIKNKIIVAPNFSFHPDLEYLIYLLSINDCRPKGIVVTRANSSLILGALLADIPIIHGFKERVPELIKSGEKITMNHQDRSVLIRV
jgi:predicted aconitase with swiveling domain